MYRGKAAREVPRRVISLKALDSFHSCKIHIQSLARTRGWLRGKDATELVEHPVTGGIKPFEMLLGTSRHCKKGTSR